LKRSEWYASTRVEANTLTLKEATLPCGVFPAETDCALRVHDPLPRNGLARRQRVKRVPHEPRLPWQPGEARYLSVGGHSATRYP